MTTWEEFKTMNFRDLYSVTIGIKRTLSLNLVTLALDDMLQAPGDPPQIDLAPEEVQELIGELVLAWKTVKP